MKGLSRVIYSSSRNSSCTDSEIDRILESCRRNNVGKGITGVLLHSDNRFIQYLEGESETVLELYELIKSDTRHSGVLLITHESLKERIFPSWHMGYKNVFTKQLTFNSDITKKDWKIFNSLIEGQKMDGDRCIKTLKKFFETSVL